MRRTAGLLTVSVLLLAGCFGAPSGDDPAPRSDPVLEDDPERDSLEDLIERVNITGDHRFHLEGPGPAEFHIQSHLEFTINRVAYYNPDGASINGSLEFWVLLDPLSQDEARPQHCDDERPPVLIWHNAMENSNVFWHELEPGAYRLAYGTPAGTHLELDVRQEYDFSQNNPERENVTVRPSLYTPQVLPSDPAPEGTSTGIGVHGSARIEHTPDNDSILFTRFQAQGIHLGTRSIEAIVVDANDRVCAETEQTTGAFSTPDIRLATFVPANVTVIWQGSYEAEAGFNSRPQDTHLLLQVPPWDDHTDPLP